MNTFGNTRRNPAHPWIAAFAAVVFVSVTARAALLQDGQAPPAPEKKAKAAKSVKVKEPPPLPPAKGPQERVRQPQRPPGPPPGLWNRMAKEERERIEAFIEEHFPRLSVELDRLKVNKPQAFERRMRRIAPEMLHLMEAMDIHPEHGTMMIQERRTDMEIRRLSQQFRSTDDKEKRKRLRKKVRDLCGQAFDLRHARRAFEIRALEVRLDELKQRHSEAAAMRKDLVDQAVRERLHRPAPPPPLPREREKRP